MQSLEWLSLPSLGAVAAYYLSPELRENLEKVICDFSNQVEYCNA